MVDILAIGAHPDDIELGCGGTLLKQLDAGFKVGLLDLCEGELGTRGNRETRSKEARAAAQKMGVEFRWNARLPDGFMFSNRENNSKVAAMIRKARPKLVIAGALRDRHPDHGRSAEIVREAFFLSGLQTLELESDGKVLQSWRPQLLIHYIQDYHLVPDFVVDIRPYMEKKVEIVKEYKTQFYNPGMDAPATPISNSDYFQQLEAKARTYGRYIASEFGEGFMVNRPLGIDQLMDLK